MIQIANVTLKVIEMKKCYYEKADEKPRKKMVDIESEFIGAPVGQARKKDREPDLTDEMKRFLREEITLDSIKDMLIRWEGKWAVNKITDAKIKIYAIKGFDSERCEYVIKMKFLKNLQLSFYLSRNDLFEISFFSNERLGRSMLKQEVIHKIRSWLDANPDKTIKMD